MPEMPGARTPTCRISCWETSIVWLVALGSFEVQRNAMGQVLIARGWGFGSATVRASSGLVQAPAELAPM